MSLFDARNRVLEALVDNRVPTVESVVEWFQAYKTWEAGDTVGKAFHSCRLTIRTYIKPGETGSKWNLKYAANQTKDSSGTKEWEGWPQDVSGKAVIARTNPLNFAPGPSQKYSLGLHDLSASLLDPHRNISEQLYHALNREDKDGSYAIFMPLPIEGDLQLFDRLNRMAKRIREDRPRLYELIQIYRSRMTRIKQAYEYDIGAGFSATPRKKPAEGKPDVAFKYGVGSTIKVIGKGLTRPEEGVNDAPTLMANALSYKKILLESATKGKYNEITIAYRQHANPRFPQAAIWSFGAKEFKCFMIDGKGEAGTLIKDRPARED